MVEKTKRKLSGLRKSRTAYFAAFVMSLGVIETNISVIPEEYRGLVLIAIGMATVWLRVMTDRPLEQK